MVAESIMVAGALLLLVILAACSAQEEGSRGAGGFAVSSEAFPPGGRVPSRYTCVGSNTSPEVRWEQAPAGAKGFAAILDDPDAPGGVFTHWLVYGIPGNQTGLSGGIPKVMDAGGGIRQGINDFGNIGYGGPCPPPGRPHRYVLRIYAVDIPVILRGGADRQALEAAMEGHILAVAQVTAVFGR